MLNNSVLNTNVNISKSAQDLRDLQLLEEISKDSSISQRRLSQKIDLALGATNFCLKRMVKKGYVKIKGINHKRISYYLTAEGISEKAKLTYYFLEYTIHHYKNLKTNLFIKLNSISEKGIKRVVFYGADETIEIIFTSLQESNLELIGIIDGRKERQGKEMFGIKIQDMDCINELNPDAILVSSIRNRDEITKRTQIPVYTLG